MAHYAFLDENNVVTEVIVGKDEAENGVNWEAYYAGVRQLPASQCKRTSYHTINGEHLTGGTPYRHNFAAVGYTFVPEFGPDGAFLPPSSSAGDPASDAAFREAATL